MKRMILSILAIFALASVAVADEASHREAAVRVIEASQVQKSLEQIQGMFEGMLSQQMGALEVPSEGKAAFEAMQAEMSSLMSDLLTWEELSEFTVTTYVEFFSEEELNELTDFYKSELGQKLIERQPEIMQKSMQWAQTKVQERMPEFLKRLEEATAEFQEQFEASDSPEG